MSHNDIVTPVATVDTSQCMITSPWFVQNTEYPPAVATYKPLVNGEEAFAAVYRAIEKAQKSVDIICWGVQPSMYFIRDGQALRIGELLCLLAEKQVQVRILGWEAPFNTAGVVGEANLPGKGILHLQDRAGQSATDEQYAFDRDWFTRHSYSDDLLDSSNFLASTINKQFNQWTVNPLFVGRGFNKVERAEIAWRARYQALDKGLSASAVGIMTLAPSHHQKTVLVDYELPESAIGFVMGHNMLDEYWDTDAHSSQNRLGGPAPWGPDQGSRGFLPRQDISSQVTGPILEHLHENFAKAWCKETGEDLIKKRQALEMAKRLKPRKECGTLIPGPE